MNRPEKKTLLFLLIPLLLSIHPIISFSETGQNEKLIGTGSGPIEIRSDTLEVDNKQNIVTFTGNVDVKRDDFTINCRKILLYYQSPPSGKGPEGIQADIDKIVAEGEVKIRRPAGGTATAEKAIYYSGEEKLVLTGNPVVKQGDDFVEGAKITLFLKENRSIVEGSKEGRAKAVLFPKKDKR